MKKILLSSFLLFSALTVFSQGIEFEHTSWSEVVKKAKELNKPIFVDVYTSWCGPCRVMATQVFTRPEIGVKYNQGFVNVKIDAEKGEGIVIAKKYEVKSYPTYLFINPSDESLVDRSGSSMPAADFNDVADKMLNKFSGKKEISFAELDAKYKTGDYDEVFAQAYIKRLKAEGKSIVEALGKYISKFVTNTPTTDQLFFLGSNFPKGADSNLYSYMINNYKVIDAILCKKDGIAAASFYRNLREETKTKIEDILSRKLLVSEKEAQLNKLFENIKTVEIGDRSNKKILEFKMRLYNLNADTLQLLQASRAYANEFLLPTDKTSSIGSETIIMDKNAPIPVAPVDSVRTSDYCSNFAVTLSKLSKDRQDKKLASSLLKKALALNNSFVVKNKMNIATYNFGEKKAAIIQQSKLIAEMKSSNDEYLADAETTIQKMKNNESNISPFSYRKKPTRKH
ncbi:thioredoxin family protein [Solitalea koreensis]|uniref:Thioredoxin-like n=1 Tax=Solitalea koreensis TaxID=543615 RepID=A0A521AVI3_9SPHI|nr:thioredoxin family protein [Solitalea koreensis]SMO38827.1 Thioredoxin-like [Solitalea koreensis]